MWIGVFIVNMRPSTLLACGLFFRFLRLSSAVCFFFISFQVSISFFSLSFSSYYSFLKMRPFCRTGWILFIYNGTIKFETEKHIHTQTLTKCSKQNELSGQIHFTFDIRRPTIEKCC